jgi:hypothetical protein
VEATPGESLTGRNTNGKDSVIVYKGAGTTVRMETPVIYFHSGGERSVSVQVDFPQGSITEWYPPAVRTPNRITWPRVDIVPGGGREDLIVEEADRTNHYYAARDTEAALLRAGDRAEKFLFYRGCGVFQVPLTVKLQDAARLTLTGTGLTGVVVFENRGGKIGFRLVPPFDAETSVDRPALDGSVAALERELQTLLTGTGLTDREASAMIATWRGVWFEEGLRVFYLVPRAETDRILPLKIDPPPQQLVRTLVGRMEILTPEMQKDIATQANLLTSAERPAALQRLARYGRFARPILERLHKTTRNANTKRAIEKVLMGDS